MLKCPFCHFDNEDGALFCEQCKSDLAGVESVTPPLAGPGAAAAPPAEVIESVPVVAFPGAGAVQEAVVAGIPHPVRGETVKAYVVLKPGQVATSAELIDFCKEQLAAYKVPTMVEFRSELPKSMVGKFLRRVLVEEEKAKLAGDKVTG